MFENVYKHFISMMFQYLIIASNIRAKMEGFASIIQINIRAAVSGVTEENIAKVSDNTASFISTMHYNGSGNIDNNY